MKHQAVFAAAIGVGHRAQLDAAERGVGQHDLPFAGKIRIGGFAHGDAGKIRRRHERQPREIALLVVVRKRERLAVIDDKPVFEPGLFGPRAGSSPAENQGDQRRLQRRASNVLHGLLPGLSLVRQHLERLLVGLDAQRGRGQHADLGVRRNLALAVLLRDGILPERE